MSANPAGEQQLDARGLRCPEPVMLLHAQIRRMTAGETVRVVADDPSTLRDIPKFCAHLGHALIEQSGSDGVFVFVVRKRG